MDQPQASHARVSNGVHPQPNGLNDVQLPTPVEPAAPPDAKPDIDAHHQESDVRHEPVPLKSIDPADKPDLVSIVPDAPPLADASALPSPSPSPSPAAADSNRAAAHLPNGKPSPTLAEQSPQPEDVKMHDASDNVPQSNASHLQHDVVMHDAENEAKPASILEAQPESTPVTVETNGTSSPAYTAEQSSQDDDDKPRPAKRARMHSDADKASLAHSATPPPASAAASASSTPVPPSTAETLQPTTLNYAQFRFCQSTVRSLKKLKDASPFLHPVDPIALNIPHYPSIIKHPMDFSTIERKLTSSNPNKADPNPQNPRYHSADEFVSDVRLIFQNCLTFNGPDHAIVLMGKRVEQVFDKQIKQMPQVTEPKLPAPKKVATPPPPPPVVQPPPQKKVVATRRASTSVPVIRRSETEAVGRPKREIHPPPPKDLLYADVPKKQRKVKRVKDDGTAEQLKFCSKLLSDIHRKQYYAIASPFYEPVDWVKLDLPTYPKIVKRPMDFLTMRKKLDSSQYPSAQKFFDDFKLMIRNCFLFNPAGTPVNQAGIELQRVFDEKWKQLPPLRDLMSEEEEDDDEDDSEDERQRAIALMESQIETMRGNIAALKGSKLPKEKKKKEKKDKLPLPSSSKAANKQNKAPSKKKGKKVVADNDVLTFEQKKDLSESIQKLDESKLEKVIQIIHEGVPEIRDSTEEIELEIDTLPAAVLTKLYNFVIRPMRQPPVKRNRTGKGTGTGGLKRKSMDEDVEAEKIRLLEERMALFEQKEANGGAPPVVKDDDSEHSSDSSSNSDSSGSDSE